MNYRHAYHAGNFADVLKHAVLAWILQYMSRKAKPFRVIDTHAGIGQYDLHSEEAAKTGEWREGIGRLLDADIPRSNVLNFAPYLDVIGQLNSGSPIKTYPGSPLIARKLMRGGDRLVVNEMHRLDRAQLSEFFRGDPQVKVLALDGWTAVKSLLPPAERRGVVLIDPPFEQAGEYGRLVDGLAAGVRRFASGVYLLWYPIKDRVAVAAFKRGLVATGLDNLLCAELRIGSGDDAMSGLQAAGIIIHNPPYGLYDMLEGTVGYLKDVLSRDDTASGEVTWLVAERARSC